MIDRHSPLPLYFQLARLLGDDIVGGRWSPGDRLMSEPDVAMHFGVSRATVRQAFQRLESEGLIRREKGRGTFVALPRERSWLLQSAGGFFHEEVHRLGWNVTSRVLRAEQARLPRWATSALDLPQGSDGVVLERLRFVDGEVALFVADFLPARFAEFVLPMGDEDDSLYDRLEKRLGVTVYGGRRTLEAAHPEPRVAKLLEVRPRSPLVFIESVSWNSDMQPFHAFHSWLRTDRIRVEVRVAHAPSPPLVPSTTG